MKKLVILLVFMCTIILCAEEIPFDLSKTGEFRGIPFGTKKDEALLKLADLGLYLTGNTNPRTRIFIPGVGDGYFIASFSRDRFQKAVYVYEVEDINDTPFLRALAEMLMFAKSGYKGIDVDKVETFGDPGSYDTITSAMLFNGVGYILKQDVGDLNVEVSTLVRINRLFIRLIVTTSNEDLKKFFEDSLKEEQKAMF